MDGNVERVMSRLYLVNTPLPAAKAELTGHAAALTPQNRPGDYAQAVMDLGATICSPRAPKCGLCPWAGNCLAREAGTAETYPKKTPRAPKPTRYGVAYVARRTDGAWLLERRPDKGLLGGMSGWPGAPWGDKALEAPPVAADWKMVSGEVRHTFTHFHLILSLRMALVAADACPVSGRFVAAHEFRPTALPTVMRKVFDLALSQLPHCETR